VRTLGRPNLRLWQVDTLQVALFDVFDTLIGRDLRRPEDVHSLVADRLVERGTLTIGPGETVRLRLEAQRRVERQSGSPSTLEEIHEEMALLGGWPLGLAQEISHAEIEAELDVSCRLDEGWRLLCEAREAGLRVIFVSDMYLPSGAIRAMLGRHCCWRTGDTIWVSAESRARKRDGSLFQLLFSIEGFTPAATVHVGDNPVSDRIVPRWLGIGAKPVSGAS